MSQGNKPSLAIDSHVVIQLGSELISDSEQAILELVKNAYGGDARTCEIDIDPKWSPAKKDRWFKHFVKDGDADAIGRIVVRDNGIGLEARAVTDGWLTISASLKRASPGDKKKSPLGRVPVGDKGLGRLATMRLGDVLKLRTMTTGELHTRSVSFAWTDFKPGVKLEDVIVQQERLQPFLNKRSGTDVEILGLSERSYWDNPTNIKAVVAKLSTLISPFRRFKNFRVALIHESVRHDLQDMAAEALNYASAKFEVSWSDGRLKLKCFFAKSLFRGQSGNAAKESYEKFLADAVLPKALEFFKAHRKISNRGFSNLMREPGGWLFSLEEELNWEEVPADPNLPFARDPGPFSAELYYFLFNEETKKKLAASNVSSTMLQNMSGLGIFRDGFRVRMSDDWLGLSEGVTSGGFFQL